MIGRLNKNVCYLSCKVMWRAVERAVGPGFDREKCEVKLVGTPLTHKRFLRRNRGTYGPAIKAGHSTFPGHSTPIPQLFCCGDSTFPGIGVPAVAASGAIVANTLVPVSQHSELLDAIGIWSLWSVNIFSFILVWLIHGTDASNPRFQKLKRKDTWKGVVFRIYF